MKKVNITANEENHYIVYSGVPKFKSAQEEYVWAETQTKECNKCHTHLPLTCFGFSTSGRFPFNKNGVRYRRGECLNCGNLIQRGKSKAKRESKKLGLAPKPTQNDKCALCGCSDNLVFDHDHKNEVFRGWLCDPCNRSNGTLESRLGSNWLQLLIEYHKR
jgi:hypothetical protein